MMYVGLYSTSEEEQRTPLWLVYIHCIGHSSGLATPARRKLNKVTVLVKLFLCVGHLDSTGWSNDCMLPGKKKDKFSVHVPTLSSWHCAHLEHSPPLTLHRDIMQDSLADAFIRASISCLHWAAPSARPHDQAVRTERSQPCYIFSIDKTARSRRLHVACIKSCSLSHICQFTVGEIFTENVTGQIYWAIKVTWLICDL